MVVSGLSPTDSLIVKETAHTHASDTQSGTGTLTFGPFTPGSNYALEVTSHPSGKLCTMGADQTGTVGNVRITVNVDCQIGN